MLWSIYILLSKKKNRTYVGCSHNVRERLERYNSGGVKATKNGCPWKLVYQEEVETYFEARRREKYYKSGAGRRKIAEILKNGRGRIVGLVRTPGERVTG